MSWLSTKPERGDHVRVSFEGVYSHQGGGPGSSGFHIVEVDGGLGRLEAAAPPNAQIEVIRKAPPPEPPLDSLVTPSLGPLPTAIFVRESDGWRQVGQLSPFYTWQELVGSYPGMPLRPVYVDPLADAPKLPLKVQVKGADGWSEVWLENEDTHEPPRWVRFGSGVIPRDEARRVAKAILAATGGL